MGTKADGVLLESFSGGGIVVHRPERTFARPPAAEPVRLSAPPAPPDPDARGGAWMVLTPVIGSLTLVAFAFIVRNPIYLAVAFFVVVAMVGAVLGQRIAARRAEKRRWARQRAAWLRRVARTDQVAAQRARAQYDALNATHPAPQSLLAAVRDHGALWERRRSDPDFLTVRVGTGPVPAAAPVVCPTEDRDPGDEELDRTAEELVAGYAVLPDAPVTVDLADLDSLVIAGHDADRAAGRLIAELAATCPPDQVHLMGLIDTTAVQSWEWAKWLPHTRDASAGDSFGKTQRHLSTDPGTFTDALAVAIRERQPIPGDDDASHSARLAALPELVVVITGYSPDHVLADDPTLTTLLAAGRSLGVTVLVTVEDPTRAPSSSSALLRHDEDTWTYLASGPQGRVVTGIHADTTDPDTLDRLARWLAPRTLVGSVAGRRDGMVRLSELLGVDRFADLGKTPGRGHSSSIYSEVPPEDLLTAPLGVTDDGTPVRLNLREAAQGGDGPHGVMVGATGSGKSELLRTLVAGLAATHRPEVLSILAIDFKGGSAFATMDDLPHLVGLITNLEEDPALVDRMQESLDGEVQRRQALLVAAGVDNIAEYHALPAHPDREPLPYLFVVIDEFSELLTARPEFISSLVAIGRLGRSLGIHMLLATQRLEEGRLRGLDANLRYRIALRTFTAQDSRQILGSGAAHELPPGLGYIKVDGAPVRFKAALSTLPERSTRNAGVVTASTLAVGFTLARSAAGLPEDDTPAEETGTELEALRNRILAEPHATPRAVWLPPLPERLTLANLHAATPGPGEDWTVPLALRDRPHAQAQDVFALTARSGHLAVVGAPQSGKSTTLRTLAVSATCDRSPADVQIYAIDGGGALTGLADLPHTGAIANRNDPDATRRLLADVHAVARERAAACRAAGVATMAELRALPDAEDYLPDPLRATIWLLIDGIGLLRTDHPDDEIELASLAATSLPYDIRFAVAAGRWLDIRPGLLDAISTRIELRLNDPADSQISRQAAKTLPRLPGRGLIGGGEALQVALPVTDPGELADEPATVAAIADDTRTRYGTLHAPRVLPLPRSITLPEALELTGGTGRTYQEIPHGEFVAGIREHRLTPVTLDLLAPGRHLYAFGDQATGKTTLLRRIAEHLIATRDPDQVQLHIIDLNRSLLDLADADHVAEYAFTLSQATQIAADLRKVSLDRLPPPTLTRRELLDRTWWTGPEHVLLVDDYQLLLHGADGPLSPLADALAQAHDVGLHAIVTRTVAGASRTMFEPFGKRMTEVAPVAVVLPGDHGEGPLAAGLTARAGPPGRAQIAVPGSPAGLIQLIRDPQEPR